MIVDKKNDNFIIADSYNQRVVQWPCRNGTNRETIISNIDCCGLAMDSNGYLYVSDTSKHEVRRDEVIVLIN
jgi:sugar lactone lactonase YvrE